MDVDLAQVAADVARGMRPFAAENGLDVEVSSDGAAVVRTDPDRVHQMLANLTENALRVSPPGAVVAIDVQGRPYRCPTGGRVSRARTSSTPSIASTCGAGTRVSVRSAAASVSRSSASSRASWTSRSEYVRAQMGAASRSGSAARSALCAFALAALAACGSDRPLATPSVSAQPTSTPTPAVATSPTAVPTPTPFAERLDHGAVMDHVRVLAVEIGLRNAGSDGDDRAAEYIAERIARLGWTVERPPFPLPQGGESWNVVGTPPGFDETKPYVIVGGHFDSLNGPGANDNATGVGVAMEIARVVDDRPGSIPVVFIAFGAEERQPTPNRDDHHIGSRYHVSKMSAAARKNLRAIVNVDMVGRGDVLVQPPGDRAARGLGPVRAPRQGAGLRSEQRVTPDWSDHGSFLRTGHQRRVAVDRRGTLLLPQPEGHGVDRPGRRPAPVEHAVAGDRPVVFACGQPVAFRDGHPRSARQGARTRRPDVGRGVRCARRDR